MTRRIPYESCAESNVCLVLIPEWRNSVAVLCGSTLASYRTTRGVSFGKHFLFFYWSRRKLASQVPTLNRIISHLHICLNLESRLFLLSNFTLIFCSLILRHHFLSIFLGYFQLDFFFFWKVRISIWLVRIFSL